MTVPVAAFAAALTPIAREVGVTLPSPQAWTDRLAAIDGIDVDVLVDEAARLRSLADAVADVADAVGTVADELPAVWQGIAGRPAHSAVAEVHGSCEETGHRLRTAAGATSAAARGVTDLRAALHATLAAVPGLVLAGRAIAGLTALDLQTNRALVAALLQAAVTTVETALTVTETAITEVLTVLADSSGRLAETPDPGVRRTDVVHDPRPTVAVTGVVGALAGAGAATAAAVGMAAVGAAGVVAHIVDAALDPHREPEPPVPSPSAPSGDAVPRADRPPAETRDDTGPAEPPVTTDTDARPQLNLRYDDETPPPTASTAPTAPRDPAPLEPIPAAPPASVDDRTASVAPAEEHDTPAVATRSGPAATPDPDDGGGLALAGDR